MTKARIKVEIEYSSPNGVIERYDSEGIYLENVGCQTNKLPQLSPLKRIQQFADQTHTPVKRLSVQATPTAMKPPKIVPLIVHDLLNTAKVCTVCNLKSGSDDDKKFRKGKVR